MEMFCWSPNVTTVTVLESNANFNDSTIVVGANSPPDVLLPLLSACYALILPGLEVFDDGEDILTCYAYLLVS